MTEAPVCSIGGAWRKKRTNGESTPGGGGYAISCSRRESSVLSARSTYSMMRRSGVIIGKAAFNLLFPRHFLHLEIDGVGPAEANYVDFVTRVYLDIRIA